MMAPGSGEIMRVSAFTLVLMLCAAAGLGGCVPDVVSLEAVPTPKFSRDLARCNAAVYDNWQLDETVKRCMKQKGYHFLRQY
jgi:hypothetical protein